MKGAFDFEAFKEKLDAVHAWPSVYKYKFIVTNERLSSVEALFPKHEVTTTPSSKGKYVSVTIRVMANSSDEVIAKYKEASTIEGIIAL